MPAFSHEHLVTFEETSLVGNVYYANYILWQGHCRERFIAEYCSDVTDLLLRKQFALFTRSCECDFSGDGLLTAGDILRIDMTLDRFRGGKMTLLFEYFDADSAKIATGRQVIHCKAMKNGRLMPSVFPLSLLNALLQFADSAEIRDALTAAIEFEESSKAVRT